MGYHRNNWRQVVGKAAPYIPGGQELMAAVDVVHGISDSVGRDRLQYVRGGRPLVELPWQPPGPPPNPQRAEAVGRQAWDLLFADEKQYSARSLLDQVGNLLMPLPPTELDMVVRRFGTQGLDRWDALTHVEDEHGEPAYDWPRQQELFNWLLRTVSPYGAMLIGTGMTCSQPNDDPGCDCGDHGWVLPEGPFAKVDGAYVTENWQWVSGSTEALSWQDMYQGCFGDCWLLTSMQAVLQANPQHASRHFRQEANGTVTITFYDEGRPDPITVVPDLPYGHGRLWCATGHTQDARYAETWPGYFEKAAAQARGNYHDIAHGGPPSDALALITGRTGQKLDVTSPWVVQEIADRKSRGQALVATTVPAANAGPDDAVEIAGGRLIGNHAYFVKDVDPAGGRISLGNPWGDQATRTHWECWLTLQEVGSYLVQIDAVDTW
ncbi:C2 family cysteine protease [Streptomyces natalensis]|uniref:Peptidase C2 calpain n=1 Tax=Streptomyces natalensis ATCC 27448 TaxID=1240678 RepID=A0A0D7CHD0_9ACTN|nr:C2 family cysteine protease [Streptomyces natalensis]KIZ15250.1 peptidase C2 calpain [Streptomyces natalensis ATCC 27448]